MLRKLNISQDSASPIYEDNAAAIAMANVSQPTRRTRHLDIKHFALLGWVATDQILLCTISTHDNPAESLTKSLGPIFSPNTPHLYSANGNLHTADSDR